MRKSAFKFALIAFALYGIFRLLLFQFGLAHDYYTIAVFANMLMLLLAIFFNLKTRKAELAKEKEYTNFFDDVKTCMRAGALYALFVFGFVWLYYAQIDSGYLDMRIETRMEAAAEINFEELTLEDNPHNKTREEFLEDERTFSEFIFAASTQATFTLIGLIALSFIYSLFLAIFYRRVLAKL